MKQNTFNQTAYRILRLLEWLISEPLTIQEINERFLEEPNIQKRVSQDTLGLYLNTLKSLGCKITRPTPTNGFRYHLTYHPFSYYLTALDLQVLKDVLSNIDDQLPIQNMLHFNLWLHHILQNASNKNRVELKEQFMSSARILSLDTLEQTVHELEQYCKSETLLSIKYRSPYQSTKTIDFLPHKILHLHGTFYLLGQSADRDHVSMLRLERIEEVIPSANTELQQLLKLKQQQKQVFIIRVLQGANKAVESFSEDETRLHDPTSNDHLIFRIRTDNTFLLMQKLLSSGHVFQVLYPDSFREQLEQTLESMRQIYA